ncbi:MAG: NADH-quinone oxidoreductase subunit NuoB [Actinobacteria bacterium]|nr:NADH-quinone oxidoreductase subunit NuoB [Actinomycetota bacterium]
MAGSILKSNLNILVAGFGCCKREIFAARGPLYDIQRFGLNFVTVPENADILVVQGIYNRESLQRMIDIYERMNEPKWVFAVGSCMIDGNIFDRGVRMLEKFREKVKIDMYVPGCPPRPEAFIYAVLKFLDYI